MATIHLNNKDLRIMIKEAVERLFEEQWYETEPLYEFAHKAVKKALREALLSQANTNASRTRKSCKNDFCA